MCRITLASWHLPSRPPREESESATLHITNPGLRRQLCQALPCGSCLHVATLSWPHFSFTQARHAVACCTRHFFAREWLHPSQRCGIVLANLPWALMKSEDRWRWRLWVRTWAHNHTISQSIPSSTMHERGSDQVAWTVAAKAPVHG